MSDWISVKDRLPEADCHVLCYYGFGSNEGRYMGTLDYYATDPDPHFQHEGLGLIAYYWMPLPEPPKGADE